jgi:hypothetical protein
MAGNPEDSGFVYFVRQADAIISTGNYEQVIDLPPVSRVIGGIHILETENDAAGPVGITLRHVLGSTDQLGSGLVRGRQY